MTGEPAKGAHALRSATRPHFDEALEQGFPSFLTAIAESNPVNASPYLCGYEEFRSIARGWDGRQGLLDALDHVRTSSADFGATVQAMLIGGSFADLANVKPDDIDCLMFYRPTPPTTRLDSIGLGELRKQAKRRRVDVRFLPLDADPIVLIKSLCYFTTLFCQTKSERRGTRTPRGLLLLDCRV